MFSKEFAVLAAGVSTASAAIYSGFNYGSGTDFGTEFALAKSLVGTNSEFTSARLYTTIEENTSNTPTSAISAAISNDVSLLLGIWASGGQTTVTNEIAALTAAIATYGSSFTSRVVGISVGSEDLYRISPTGIENLSGAGAEPTDLVSYISQVRSAIAGTALSGVPVGHVDTWTAWVNGSNDAVISACDFLGMDAYPYFQTTETNDITQAYDLFFSAYDQTVAASQGKSVWVTETGWPASGPNAGDAVPSTANAETYWQEVACKLLGSTNTWWYTLNDAGASPSFGVTTGSSTPLYNLACNASSSSSSSSTAASSTSSAAASGSSTTAAASTTSASSSGAALSSAASSAAATASNSIVPVTSSAVPTQAGGGSPGASSSAAADSSAASVRTSSPAVASSQLASASSALSAASTNSTATVKSSTASATGTSSGSSSASGSAVAAGSGSSSSAAASGSSATTGTTMASSAAASGTTGSSATSKSSSATASSTVASYTGGAATLISTGGFVAAIVAMLAAF